MKKKLPGIVLFLILLKYLKILQLRHSPRKMWLKYRFLFAYSFIFFSGCKKNNALFVEHHAESTGIRFENTLTPTAQFNILTYLYYYNGAGVAVADVNNDGLPDLYFTGNQTKDKLYLNKGGFIFEDITQAAGIKNNDGWTTGVTTVDINHDGLLDFYVCKVAGLPVSEGTNLLWVNQGADENGKPTFKEQSAKYGLNIQAYSQQAAFFDYDLDGDLDMYLLNHSLHPNRTYGRGSNREKVDLMAGDRLFKNNNGYYEDVSAEAGIFQGSIGYGLGISVGDVNNDGYPDMYVGNDFFENDYLYINQQNGTFKDLISTNPTALGHTTHYSMGNDLADINNDELPDIISVDMLPEELKGLKMSGTEFGFQTYAGYLNNGYAPQYMQNTLHLNLGNDNFAETAFISGMAATEWSWAPLLADFDNDGFKDVFISNGIPGATNDMDFINFISNEKIQKKINQGMSEEDLSFTKELPSKHVPNYFFKNNGNLTFTNTTSTWFKSIPTFSNGAAYADLDNDGDLDLVVSNINEPVTLLENKQNQQNEAANYLKVNLKGNNKNTFAIGARVTAYTNGRTLYFENQPTRGYLSAVGTQLHIGLGKSKKIDSLKVVWPGGSTQILSNLEANKSITLSQNNDLHQKNTVNKTQKNHFLSKIDSVLPFKHLDLQSIEFNRDPLIPFAYTNTGPKTAIADANNDGLDDVFICGGKTQPSQLFFQQKDGTFTSVFDDVFLEDAINEDTDAVFFDVDNDGDKDVLVVSGGNEFKQGPALTPRLYLNNSGSFIKKEDVFKNVFVNASSVHAVDIDNDRFTDLIITSNSLPWQYGITPKQYVFKNIDGKSFKNITSTFAKEFENLGNVTHMAFTHLNNDGFIDAVAVGHWMPVTILINDGKKLVAQKNNGLETTNGWWNCVAVSDFDNDGDIDMVAGNWGKNTRLTASEKQPVTLYASDFDDNGNTEPVITYYYQGEETVFVSKDELVKQLPVLNKKFLSYEAFANAGFQELFPKEKIKSATVKQVFELASCYFENTGNNIFKKSELPFLAQLSSVNSITVDDFDKDGTNDIFLVGNNYEISTQLGRQDASHGTLLLFKKNKGFQESWPNSNLVNGPARHINQLRIGKNRVFLITMNNGTPIGLKLNN